MTNMIRSNPFVGSPEAGRAYNLAMGSEPTWRAYFTNGERWQFKATNHARAMNDARFWADFTGRELSAVAQLD